MAYYSKKVMEHFLHPKNMGKIDSPDGVGDTQNLRCGDIMKIYIKVDGKYIEDIKFETLGCGTAIAISDMICGLANGRTLAQAKQIKSEDVLKEFGDLPSQKAHCANLAEIALKSAIKDYEDKQKIQKS